MSRDGSIVATKQVVGKNKAALIGKEVASTLGLADPELYTSRCWRRMTGTWGAEAGLSLPEIKELTGHKSDRVCQGYIDRSVIQKRPGADNAMQISSEEAPNKRQHVASGRSSSSTSGHNITININGNIVCDSLAKLVAGLEEDVVGFIERMN
jgi:hypothetical protein